MTYFGERTRSKRDGQMDVGCQAASDCPITGPRHYIMNLHRYPKVARTCLRTISSGTRTRPSSAYLDLTRSNETSFNSSPLDLTHAQREALDSALRVDQAGEIAANWIYKGQMAVLGHDPRLGALIQVSSIMFATTALQQTCIGHVGPREKASHSDG